jgi:hypothetical protein
MGHIVFTQPFSGENVYSQIKSFAGLVDHTINDRMSGPLRQSNRTSTMCRLPLP